MPLDTLLAFSLADCSDEIFDEELQLALAISASEAEAEADELSRTQSQSAEEASAPPTPLDPYVSGPPHTHRHMPLCLLTTCWL